jgi:hypothetical protein
MDGRMYAAATAALLLVMPQQAGATDLESLQLANALGNVLASEEPCGLQYDQAAIAEFVANKVNAEDMGFASSLNMQTIGSKVMITEMSESQKTAHCAQTKRVAKTYGFIK